MPTPEPTSASASRAWLVWSLGVGAYTAAVLQRSSFGIASLDAPDRFGAPAGIVATFMVLQLLVYSVMQVPAGLLCDRYGPRLVIASGAALMAVGQLAMGLSADVGSALAARALVGTGDALTFSSVLTLIPAWFADRRIPLLTQLTGLIGQAGQVLSAVPFAWALHRHGWTTAFTAAAVTSLVAAVVVAALVRDRPPGTGPQVAQQKLRVREQVWQALRQPGTQLGFWMHWVSGFPAIVFAMMWGVPYLVRGEGVSPTFASVLLTVMVVSGLALGPAMGVLTQRHPLRRTNLTLTASALTMLPWAVVLLWPGPAPAWLLVVLMIGLGAGGPGTAVGFDMARTFNPSHRIGTATGIVIMGAFLASIGTIWLAGLVLDTVGQGRYDLRSFRWAMATQFLFFGVGLIGLYEARHRARKQMARNGVVVPRWQDAIAREWRRRRP